MKLQTEPPHDTAIPAVKKTKLTDKNMAISFTQTMNNIKSKLLPRIPFTMMPKRCLYLLAVFQQVDKAAAIGGRYQTCQSS